MSGGEREPELPFNADSTSQLPENCRSMHDKPAFRSVAGPWRIEYVLVDDYEIGAVGSAALRTVRCSGSSGEIDPIEAVQVRLVGMGFPQIRPHSEGSPCKRAG